MRAADAIAGALVLGARVLIPIHHSLRPAPPLLHIASGLADLPTRPVPGLHIVPLGAGQRWSLDGVDKAA